MQIAFRKFALKAALMATSVAISGAAYGYASEDGDRWEILRDFPLAASAAVEVGFVSQAPSGSHFAARFSDIRFEAKSLKEYWQGT
ncbi:DUF1349 domain-containing protein [Sphingomonas sp.]|uniref:DUF1349 domain-containing protein n=1 Tax=Sphingomonas sp. TaxID=28214 RepID=UPI002FDACAD4